MWILDIADSNIRLSRDGEVVYSEPGLALVEPKSLVFGDEALANLKLHPDREQSQYWQRLDQSPVHPPGFAVETHADLIYRQLLAIKSQGGLADEAQVWVAVSSDLSHAQLALLYGIAVQARIKIRDFLDRGVAAAASVDVGESCAFVEVGLHRSIVTQLRVGDVVTRDRVAVEQRIGFLSLLNAWIKLAADKFLDTARFDPRKFAETEQQVFDQLLGFLALDEDSHVLHVEHQGNSRQVEVSRSELVSVARDRMRGIFSHIEHDCPVLLSEDAASLPGIVEVLGEEGSKCYPSGLGDIADAALRVEASDSESDQRAFHVEIPHVDRSRRQISHQPHVSPDATHVLKQSIAHVIGEEFAAKNVRDGTTDFALRRNSHGLVIVPSSSATVLLNGERVHEEAAVKVGDSIMASAIEYQLIAVEEDG